jgi:hypothetical protein
VPDGAPVGSPEGFPPVINYFGCEGGVCTSFSWGTPVGEGGPFEGQSGASINLGGDWDTLGTGTDPNPETGVGGTFGDDSTNDTRPRSPFNTPLENSVAWDPNTLGTFLPLGSLTHFNEPITGDNAPDPGTGDDNGFVGKVGVDYSITVEKFDPDGNSLGSAVLDDLIFDVVFFETLNSLSGDDCPTQVIGGDCADSFEFFGDTFQEFEIAGHKYTIELVGFCTGLDASGALCGDGRFISAEGTASTGFVFEIKEAPVPGVLALVGAGLIGLGFARRRQAKA